MKKFVLLLFFVVPHLMYASFETHACNKALERIDAEWATHNTLLVQFEAIPEKDKIQGLPFLRNAIESCHRAIGHCDYILGKIEHKSKRERQQHYWTHVKGECKQYKTALLQEIDKLNWSIFVVFAQVEMGKAGALHQKATDKAEEANRMRMEYPRRLDNVENVRAMLSNAIKLYEEANVFLGEAFEILVQYSPIEDVKKVMGIIQQTMDAYRESIHQCHKEIIGWAETVVSHVVELKKQLALLVAERDIQMASGNTELLTNIEKDIVKIVKELIACGDEDVSEELKALIIHK